MVTAQAFCIPLISRFTNTTTNGATYLWNFGNGNTSVATSPVNSYSTPANYTVQLIATDANGCTDTAYGHVSLYGYSGSFSYSPLSGCPPLTVHFTANITNIPSITWDFSDGTVTTPSTATTISHTYLNPGRYLPKVILGDSSGCHASSYGLDTIKVDRTTARFYDLKNPVCIYDTARFRDTSTSLFTAIANWQWNLGDNSYSAQQYPVHVYHTAGTYTVTLMAGNAAGCVDTATGKITISPLPLITATGDTVICPGDSAQLTAGGGVSYSWTPTNTLGCAKCAAPYVHPDSPATYIVTGTDASGCRNTDSVQIGIKYKTTSSVAPASDVCSGQKITLHDTGSTDATAGTLPRALTTATRAAL